MHLGPKRISTEIVGLGIEMQDPSAATTFYEQKLGFQPASQPLEQSLAALDLPGQSGAQIEFVPPSSSSAFRLLFTVPDLRRTAGQLKALQLPFAKEKAGLSTRDPDGNMIVFVKAKS